MEIRLYKRDIDRIKLIVDYYGDIVSSIYITNEKRTLIGINYDIKIDMPNVNSGVSETIRVNGLSHSISCNDIDEAINVANILLMMKAVWTKGYKYINSQIAPHDIIEFLAQFDILLKNHMAPLIPEHGNEDSKEAENE